MTQCSHKNTQSNSEWHSKQRLNKLKLGSITSDSNEGVYSSPGRILPHMHTLHRFYPSITTQCQRGVDVLCHQSTPWRIPFLLSNLSLGRCSDKLIAICGICTGLGVAEAPMGVQRLCKWRKKLLASLISKESFLGSCTRSLSASCVN